MSKRRFTVDDRGWLVDRDGAVLGKVVGITIETPPANVLGVGGKGVISELGTVEDKKAGRGVGEPSTGDGIRQQVEALHEHVVATLSPKHTALSPSRERMYRKGLAEMPLDVCKQAIEGLLAWQRRKGGDLNVSRVFQTRPGGSPLGEQIEFFAKQAPSAGAGSAVVPSEVAASISDAKRNVHRGVAFPGNAMAKRQMEEAKEYLESVGVIVSVVFDPMSQRQVARFSDGEEA